MPNSCCAPITLSARRPACRATDRGTAAIEAQFHKIGFSDYSYAEYQYEQSIGNYFGTSPRLYQGQKQALYDRLAQQLRQMRDRGEIALIYNRYGVARPDSVE
jgi:polar amino acid transport system substrate-binding protein